MTPICNDQLTLIGKPSYAGSDWKVPRTYRVGDKGLHNSRPYTIKAFGSSIHKIMGVEPVSREHPCCVAMLVKFRDDTRHAWTALYIGDTNCFQEKLVFGGRHRNPAFTHYWPDKWPQPL